MLSGWLQVTMLFWSSWQHQSMALFWWALELLPTALPGANRTWSNLASEGTSPDRMKSPFPPTGTKLVMELSKQESQDSSLPVSPRRRRRQWKRKGPSSLPWWGQPRTGAQLTCERILKAAFDLSELPLRYSFSNLLCRISPNSVSQICPILLGQLF